MAKVFDFFKERYVFITYCLFIFFALFSCFWSWAAFVLVGVLAIGAIFFNVNQLVGLTLFSKCFDVLYKIGDSVNDANLWNYIYAYFIVVLGVKYVITLFKTDEKKTFKQHVLVALKKVNWKILIPILVLIIYWLLPIHTTSIKAVGVNSLDFILLYLIFEMRKEIKFSYVVKMFCLGLVISGLMALLRPVSERLDLILSYYTNYGYLRFSGLLWHANHMGMIAVIAIAALFLLKYRNKIGLFEFYVFLIPVYIFGYCSISRNFIINFLIVLLLFLVAYIVKYKKESIKPLCIMFAIFVVISGIFFNETKINLVRLNVLPESVIVNEEDSSSAEWARIDFESDIDEGEYIKYSDEWWKEVYKGNIRYDPGREKIWEEYINDWKSSVTTILFGRGVAQPYIGVLHTHNVYLKVLWRNGIVGILIYFWILLSLINFQRFKQLKYYWTSIILIVPFLVMGIVESSPMTSVVMPFLILYLPECFERKDKEKKVVHNTIESNVNLQKYKLSIIVLCYNGEKYIEKAMENLFNQDVNMEIIVINDGSTDNSLKMLEKYGNKIKIYSNEKQMGISYSRNIGIMKATGDYTANYDIDDLIEPNMFKDMLAKIVETGADICICDYDEVDEDGKFITNSKYELNDELGKDVYKNYLLDKIGPAWWNKVFKMSYIKKKRFDESLLIGEDLNFCLGAFSEEPKTVFVDEVLYHYTQRNTSIMHDLSPKHLHFLEIENKETFKKLKEKGDNLEELESFRLQMIARAIHSISNLKNKYNKQKVYDYLKSFCTKQNLNAIIKNKNLSKFTRIECLIMKTFGIKFHLALMPIYKKIRAIKRKK